MLFKKAESEKLTSRENSNCIKKMKQKLELNKKVISSLNRSEMEMIKGGTKWTILTISIASCERGTRLGKECCDHEFGVDPTA